VQEVELKLALPSADTADLLDVVLGLPMLNGLATKTVQLHNIYYDSQDQQLRQGLVALRLRRSGTARNPVWMQTLKTGAVSDSALSKRGEWESPVKGAALDLDVLMHTPWADLDPDGVLFANLVPCFVTAFDRNIWLVEGPEGSVVEVALDIGTIEAGDRSAAIAELELELKAGAPGSLFELAGQIAKHLAVIPASASKSERGYALAANRHCAALTAQPIDFEPTQELSSAAKLAMREMFSQFTGNLQLLQTSDEAEVVHQARIGWRRFSSATKLFRSGPGVVKRPDNAPLLPLRNALSALRDLDVARMEVLPQFAQAYVSGDSARARAWQKMELALGKATSAQREATIKALMQPEVGSTLLEIANWLEFDEGLHHVSERTADTEVTLRTWAKNKVKRLHGKLMKARDTAREANSPEQWHHVRLIAKRVRYSIEAVQSVLPKKRAQQWREQSLRLQSKIGSSRDVVRASELVASLPVDKGLVGFLRGVASQVETNARSTKRRHQPKLAKL
jgi:inorganic triphosphatase YgiF